ncbi:MAG: hypothetical protein CL537_04910 [Alcanivoracaceae bacterium]|nr:hypothetical protein [Alcanivoracaceae bacterium]|tara:strand:- start:2248 stop:3174 length:927 start_codon:yes stop_codon:yes gene_type:complete
MISENTDLERLVEDFPHVEEKAIVNFINGFEVISDHLREKRKVIEKGYTARFVDGLTGSTAKRQERIDSGIEGSLSFLKDYVVANEKRLARNESFLNDVMEGVSLISGRLQGVSEDVGEIRISLDQLAETVATMEEMVSQRLNYHDLYNSAMAEKDLALSIFSKEGGVFSPEQSLWMLLTRLKYGDFGSWIESGEGNAKHMQTADAVMKKLKNDCLDIMSNLTGRSPNALIDRASLYATLSSDDQLLKDALCLVSDQESNLLDPVIFAVNSDMPPQSDNDMPFVFSNISIYDELSRIFEVGGRHVATQ